MGENMTDKQWEKETPNAKLEKTETWEETFKRRFFYKDDDGFYLPLPTPELIGSQKAFIERLISQELKKERERIEKCIPEKLKPHETELGFNEAIEQMRKHFPN